jgi:hypothetical protein
MTRIDIGGIIKPINNKVRNSKAHHYSLEETTYGKLWYMILKGLSNIGNIL